MIPIYSAMAMQTKPVDTVRTKKKLSHRGMRIPKMASPFSNIMIKTSIHTCSQTINLEICFFSSTGTTSPLVNFEEIPALLISSQFVGRDGKMEGWNGSTENLF